MAENKNMRIWNQVDKSDPAYLKTVTIGRSFTAIDPQYQVMKATETFGPVGEGWGWTSSVDTVGAQNGQIAVMAHVTIWHGSRENSYGPFTGCRTFFKQDKKGTYKFAEDAPKMAVTDGLTKALSHLGFNADVFLGKYDGNKYDADSGNNKNSGGW